VISYTGRSIVGTVVTLTGVTRGLEGSTASPWSAGTPTFQGITAGVITQKLDASGTAAKATQLATARTIALGGLLGGEASFDGSGNVTITATMADGALSIAKTSGLQTALNAKANTASLAAVATSGAYGDLSGRPTLGSAAAQNTSAFATATQGATADAAMPASGGNMTGPLIAAGLSSNGVGFARGAGVGARIWKDSSATDLWYFDQLNGADIIFRTSGSSERLRIGSTGGITASGAVTATDHINSSDARLKHAIELLSADAHLADMLELCTWLWNSDDRRGYGLIAQRVQEICPRYVFTDGNGMLGIDKASIAMEAVIGLASRVCALEDRA
jgi:hypothetical protein